MTGNYKDQFESFLRGELSYKYLNKAFVVQILQDHPYSPYGHLLNYLLAFAEKSSEASKLLQKLATYCPDRVQLQKILRKYIEGSSELVGISGPVPSEGRNLSVDRYLFEFDFHRTEEEKPKEKVIEPVAIDIEPVEEKDGMTFSDSENQVLSPYVQWLQSLKTTKKIAKVQQEEINDQPEEIIETETESTKISPPVEMKQGDFFGEVITETLAEVLANQGQYQRAIAMYEKLSLIFPEKSAFFAARIENLKNS